MPKKACRELETVLFPMQAVVASVLGMPANRVTVRVKRMGGGFGGKESRSIPLAAVTAVCARKVGKPVRIMLDR